MTHSPPTSAVDFVALPREHAVGGLRSERRAARVVVNDKARLAILSPPGLVVSASPAMLALFKANDGEALEARLMRGDGPSARRLRHLAETLPVGEPRLEPLRIVVDGGRSASICAASASERPKARAGSWRRFRLWALASDAPPSPAETARLARLAPMSAPDLGEEPPPYVASTPSPNSRFLWTLDEEGRFGAPDPVLVGAVGANAPQRGEPVEAFFRRVGLDRGDELARVLGERQTFSNVPVEWPLSELGRRRLIALSAAPMFGRQREFLGYRGFGVLGEEIETFGASEAGASEDHLPAERAEDDRSALPEALEPKASSPTSEREAEAQAPESAVQPVEPNLESAPTEGSEAAQSSAEADEGAAHGERMPKPRGRQASRKRGSRRPKPSGSRQRRISSIRQPMLPTSCLSRLRFEADAAELAAGLHRGERARRARSGNRAAGSHRAPRGERAPAAAA